MPLPHPARCYPHQHLTGCPRYVIVSHVPTFQHILSPAVVRLNAAGVVALEMDVKKFEAFADKSGVRHLRQCFTELRDLLAALLDADLVHMADNVALRKQMYPRLDPKRLATLLEKMAPTPQAALAGMGGIPLPPFDRKVAHALARKFKKQT